MSYLNIWMGISFLHVRTPLPKTREYKKTGNGHFLAYILSKGGGSHALPLSLYLPSRAKLCCTLQLRGQKHSSYFPSTLFFSVPSSDSSKRKMSVRYTASNFTNYLNGGTLYFWGFLVRILVKHQFRDIFLRYSQIPLNLLRKYLVIYPTLLD